MSGFGKFLLLLTLVMVPLLLPAASERTVISRIKVDIKMENPPSPSVSNTPGSNSRVTSYQRWMVLEVDYYPQAPRSGGPNQFSTYLDGVKMQVTAEFPLRGGGVVKSGDFGLFKGEQTFWTINCDGRQHTAMMFIPPHLLQRYMYMLEGYSAPRTPNKNDFKVEVVFFDRDGRELGRGYFGVSGNAAKQLAYFQRLEKLASPDCVINDAFVERDATPWRCMDPDQFDWIKPAGVKLPNAPTPPRTGVVLRGPKGRSRPSPPTIPPKDLSVVK